MTYANIKLERHKVQIPNDRGGLDTVEPEPQIEAFMKPFVEALALKYPHYEFVEADSRLQWGVGGDRFYAADGFKVFCRREYLGRIRVDHWCRAGKRYWVENFRINEERTRGSGFKTKHLDKALKYVGKYFGAKTTMEQIGEVDSNARRAITTLVQNLRDDARRNWLNLEKHALDYLKEEQWDQFGEWLNKKGYYRQSHTDLPEQVDNVTSAIEIAKKVECGEIVLVHTEGAKYIVQHRGVVLTAESDELPATVRRHLGMLKLIQHREMISNVGMRVDDHTFYVCGDTNE